MSFRLPSLVILALIEAEIAGRGRICPPPPFPGRVILRPFPVRVLIYEFTLVDGSSLLIELLCMLCIIFSVGFGLRLLNGSYLFPKYNILSAPLLRASCKEF